MSCVWWRERNDGRQNKEKKSERNKEYYEKEINTKFNKK